MSSSDIWSARAYAKINLGLHVNARLDNGYHDVTTGFAFIDWSDRFSIEEADEHRILFRNTDLEPGPGNLVNRARDLFAMNYGLDKKWAITIDKSIPAGAGLGGGSSDAALTLRLLNHVEQTGLGEDELCRLAAALGSDVPLFIRYKTAMGTGTGTELQDADIQPDSWILTVYPGFESSTAEAYRFCTPRSVHEFDIRNVLENEPVEEWRYLLDNDLEPPVIAGHPMVGNLKDQLYEDGAIFSLMSGSGSAVYGLFEQEFVANEALRGFIQNDMRANLTRPEFTPDRGIYRLV